MGGEQISVNFFLCGNFKKNEIKFRVSKFYIYIFIFAGASSSMMEEKKQLVEHLLAELHRGNFQPSIRQASQAQPRTDNSRAQEREKTPVRDVGPTSCAATPDRGHNPMELSHISLQGTPMMNRPNSELYDEELTLTALSARSKIVTSSGERLNQR